jgi:D-tyrosyl-tRNA(Tyr) deacylase
MIAVIQRVTSAQVTVDGSIVGSIGPGLVALVAVHRDDGTDDVAWMAGKIVSLRIFRRADKHFDIDVRESGGEVLLVSNFTVAGQTRRGRRPSFDLAAPGELSIDFFDQLVRAVAEMGVKVETGTFGADMQVALVNDGPATFILDSRSEGATANSPA